MPSVWFLPGYYLRWHYLTSLALFPRLAFDWLWFIGHFFSLKSLVQTWWSPWRRLGEEYRRGFYPSEFLATALVNLLMRLVGILMRSLMIAAGVGVWLINLAVLIILFALWLVLPWLALGFLFLGFKFLVNV